MPDENGRMKSCTAPWGWTIEHGGSVTAYKDATVPYGKDKESEVRWCNDGNLSGSYGYHECTGLPKE